MSNPNQFLDDLDMQNASPEYKREGPDWFVLFNPNVKHVLDGNLVHTLMHERWVKSRLDKLKVD
jgi:glucose repression regulatory protein TUP1